MLTAILLILLSSNAFAERLYGHFDPPKFKAQRIGLKYEMDYFDAVGNFPAKGGAPIDLATTNSFSAANIHLQSDYDLSSKLSVTFGLQVGLARSSDNEFGRDTSKLKGILIGGAYKLKNIAGFGAVLDARYYLTQAKNSLAKDRVSIGDGVNWLGGGLWLGRRLAESMVIWTYSGIKLRSGGMSDLFLYSIRPEIQAGKFKIGFGAEGYISIKDDKFTSNPVPRLEVTSGLNGNSLRYFSVNPTYHEAQGWLAYKFRPYTEMRLGAAQAIMGKNTASGLRAFLTLETSLGWNGGGLTFNFKEMKRKKYIKGKKKEKRGSFFKRKKKKKSPFKIK